jgi:hypothetical protein
MIFVVRDWFTNVMAVLSAFFDSKDPYEAQVVLKQMREDHIRKQKQIGHYSHDISNVAISERAHADLFKKGFINKTIANLVPKEWTHTHKEQLALMPPPKKIKGKKRGRAQSTHLEICRLSPLKYTALSCSKSVTSLSKSK